MGKFSGSVYHFPGFGTNGDRGKTSLFSGERLSKDHDRVEAYGDVDELNSVLGALVALLPKEKTELIEEIQRIQT